MASKDINNWVFGACEYMTLQGKRNFGNVIKLRILKWEDYPDKPGVITRVPVRERQGETWLQKILHY